jgi:hypothetical protein
MDYTGTGIALIDIHMVAVTMDTISIDIETAGGTLPATR